MSTSKVYQIRYNTVSKDDTERWRLIENGNEITVSNIIIDGHNNSGWSIDQITLYDKVKKWNEKTKNFIQLDESITGFNRLDRNTFDINDYNIRKNIVSGKYTDYHCFYPMTNYSQLNYEIYNLLPHNTS